MNNLKGELSVMDNLGIKPNYAALGRKYGMDWRTVKKYHNGYEGRPVTRDKKSRLDEYKTEIADKLAIKRITTQGVYQFMLKKYGIERIGSYSNFNRYVRINKLKPKTKTEGHPRFERNPGEQGQVDWKEDISIANKYGEIFTINVLHTTLKHSRYSHLDMSIQKRFDDVSRGLINSFLKFGGVPKELLFDNMSTVANTNVKPKRPTNAILQMSKDFGFKVRLCRTRKPETKGTVEAKNKVIDWVRAYEGEFETIEELEGIIETINKDMNITINQETDMSPTALFYKEKEYLQPLPHKSIIDTYLTPNRYKVSKESLIRYGNSRYSVDPKLIGEDVTVDLLDNKLYIYYNGKLVTFHQLNENPVNYKKKHYEKLMKGKVDENDMISIVNENLELMDNLLSARKVNVSEKVAVKSEEALIAYINQSKYGKWVINNYAHLSATDRLVFIKGMNEVLPYVADREIFISHIKFSMKENLCKNLALDCWIEDLMCTEQTSCILTQKGFEHFKKKYEKEIEVMLNGITKQAKEEEIETTRRIDEYLQNAKNTNIICTKLSEDEELPFS
ncbi:MAG: IS21 family transposase [Lachnospiraceae bacterium]|nr:IS21 family transposase [Lachnospiraceae bacterium]